MSIISKFYNKTSYKYLKISIKNELINFNNLNRNYSSLKLSQILTDAEKVIRVPMSNFNIRHLLRDEFNISEFTINKVNSCHISETNHPIVEIARNIFGTDENQLNSNRNTGSLLLLLIGKLCESLPSFKQNDNIIKKQYNFAEIYEIINKALYIHHEAVVNLPSDSDSIKKQSVKCLNDANKISILGGDYLLSYAIVRLANLIPNTVILHMIMCAIDDYCIYHFNGIRDSDGNIIPSNNMTVIDWEEMAGYGLTRLLAYGCQIILLLAKQSDRYQKAAFDFGYNLQLIWNLRDEIQSYRATNASNYIKIISLPVIFHMEYDPNFQYFIRDIQSTKHLDFIKMRQIIIEGPALGKCEKLLDFYTNKSIKSLNVFPNSVSKEILMNAIIA